MQLHKEKVFKLLMVPLLALGVGVGLYSWNDKAQVRNFDDNHHRSLEKLDDAFHSGIMALGIANGGVKKIDQSGVGVGFSGWIIDGKVFFNVLGERFFLADGLTCLVYEIQISSEQLGRMKSTLASGDDVKGGRNTLVRMANICAQYNSLAPTAVTLNEIIGYKEIGVEPVGHDIRSDRFHGAYWWFIPIIESERPDGVMVKLVAFSQWDWAHPVRVGR